MSYNKNKDLREACLDQIEAYRHGAELQHESGFARSSLSSHTKGVWNKL